MSSSSASSSSGSDSEGISPRKVLRRRDHVESEEDSGVDSSPDTDAEAEDPEHSHGGSGSDSEYDTDGIDSEVGKGSIKNPKLVGKKQKLANDERQPLVEDDEPALSHKERRRQKKKEAKLATSEKSPGLSASQKSAIASSSEKRGNLKDGDPLPKRQNSVWVGNMSFKTTPDTLRSFFEGHGVSGVTRVHMPMKVATGDRIVKQNRGFAYVDFETTESKGKAIALSEQPLLGRRLLIKDGDDFNGRPVPATSPAGDTQTHTKTELKILAVQKQPPAPTLFLGNLGFETTEEEIKEMFDRNGRAKLKRKQTQKETDGEDVGRKNNQEQDVGIRKVRMGTFEDSGLCKGFAFVDFTSLPSATSALLNPRNYILNGRKLVVEYASADAVRRGGGKVAPSSAAAGKEGLLSPEKSQKRKRDANVQEFQDRAKRAKGDNNRYAHRGGRGEGPPGKVEGRALKEGSTNETARPDRKEETRAVPGAERGTKQSRTTDKLFRRSKPGAALAMAKRESAAIVPSSGKKIQF